MRYFSIMVPQKNEVEIANALTKLMAANVPFVVGTKHREWEITVKIEHRNKLNFLLGKMKKC